MRGGGEERREDAGLYASEKPPAYARSERSFACKEAEPNVRISRRGKRQDAWKQFPLLLSLDNSHNNSTVSRS